MPVLTPAQASARWSDKSLGTISFDVAPGYAAKGYNLDDKAHSRETTGATYDLRVPSSDNFRDSRNQVDYSFAHLPGVQSVADALQAVRELRIEKHRGESYSHIANIAANDHVVLKLDGEFYTAPISDVVHQPMLRKPGMNDLRDINASLDGWYLAQATAKAATPELVGIVSDGPFTRQMEITDGTGVWKRES